MIEQPPQSESELETEIERRELDARDIRQRAIAATDDRDRQVLNQQLTEVQQQIERLRARLP